VKKLEILTTQFFNKMEEDLNLFSKMEDNIIFQQMKDELNFNKMEVNLIFIQTGRQPQFFNKMEDDLIFFTTFFKNKMSHILSKMQDDLQFLTQLNTPSEVLQSRRLPQMLSKMEVLASPSMT
jgi:hypothetical protein